MAMALSRAVVMVTTLDAMAQASFSPCLVRVSTKMGMKAADSAPSPNRRRNRFGRVNATKKADASIEVPK